MAVLSVIIFFFAVTSSVFCDQTIDDFTVIPVPALGPETLIFGPDGEGPYTGVSDGRILKYEGPEIGFTEFAYVSPNRTKEECDGTTETKMGALCGRPIGMAFNYKTKELYIADAYYGLSKVGPKGGLAQGILVDGVASVWLDGIDVDQSTGVVYVTRPSSVYTYEDADKMISSNDSSGTILSYNPKTNKVKTLMTNLRGPGGVGVSKDSSFVVVSETPANSITKFWLSGSKAKQQKVILKVSYPQKFMTTSSGHFWLASNDIQITRDAQTLTVPQGLRINGKGKIMERVVLGGVYNNTFINHFHKYKDKYYIGSITTTFAGTAVPKNK